jgi:EmrB/QacA subfamily drug resistance transporter
MGGHARDHLPPGHGSGDARAMLESPERPSPELTTEPTRASPQASPQGAPRVSPRVVSLIVASAMFMEQLDGTVLATALPTMAHSFNADPLHMNIALTSYLLTLAMFIPASGRLADRFGSRTVFRGAIALFTLGSIACAQAQSLPLLVVARMVQGAGGALMSPVGRLVLLRVVSKAELVRAMAWLMIPATIGPILGPPVGGFIVTYLSWHWIFYINVPIGLAGIVLCSLYIEEMRDPSPQRFDVLGLALSGTALACLLFGIEMVTRGVGAGVGIGLIAAGVGAWVLYAWHARHCTQPVLDFRIMRIATFRLSVICGSLSRISAGAQPFLLPMMLQLGFGMSAAQSGLITFASSIGSLMMRVSAPGLLRRLGFRAVLVWVGAIAVALVATTATIRPAWPLPLIYTLLIASGFFQSLQFMAYNTIAYAEVSRARMSVATSFYTTFQQMALTLGIAVSAAALAASLAIHGRPEPLLGDFSLAFVVVAAISGLAPLISLQLERTAGAELSGQAVALPGSRRR